MMTIEKSIYLYFEHNFSPKVNFAENKVRPFHYRRMNYEFIAENEYKLHLIGLIDNNYILDN